jgi:hypothetical protein
MDLSNRCKKVDFSWGLGGSVYLWCGQMEGLGARDGAGSGEKGILGAGWKVRSRLEEGGEGGEVVQLDEVLAGGWGVELGVL